MNLSLAGKAVLVTGASRGVGLAIAQAFAAEGARLAICSRTESQIEAAADQVRQQGGECAAFVADLFDPDECIRLVDESASALGGLDILINNASTDVSTYPSKLEELTDDQLLERTMGKTMGAIRCSRAALKYLRESHEGRIVCIGGDAARTTLSLFNEGYPGSAMTVGVGNAMLAHFVKRLSNEVAGDGITVNVVHPGQAVSGDRWDRRIARLAERDGLTLEDAFEKLTARIPIGRPVDPEDIAPLVAFLASSKASAITGQSIAIDGGINPQVIY